MRLCGRITARSREELNEAFQILRDTGYDGVDFSWPEVRGFFDGNAITNQLIVANVELSPLNITSEGELCEAVALLRGEMKEVRSIPCDRVSIKTGPRKQQSLDACVLALNALLPTADELGLTLKLANGYGTRVEQLEDWRQILLESAHPRLGALIDCGEFHAAAVNPRDALREIGDLAGFVRIDDLIGRRPVPLGQGEMNVAAILQHLRQMGYTGWLGVEASGDRLASLAASREYLLSYV